MSNISNWVHLLKHKSLPLDGSLKPQAGSRTVRHHGNMRPSRGFVYYSSALWLCSIYCLLTQSKITPAFLSTVVVIHKVAISYSHALTEYNGGCFRFKAHK